MTQLVDAAPTAQPGSSSNPSSAADEPLRHDYSAEHRAPVFGLLVALPLSVALWAVLAVAVVLLVR